MKDEPWFEQRPFSSALRPLSLYLELRDEIHAGPENNIVPKEAVDRP